MADLINEQTQTSKKPIISCTPLGTITAILVMAFSTFALGVVWVKAYNPSIPFLDNGTTGATGTNNAAATKTVLDNLTAVAKASGVNTKDFDKCVAEGKGKAFVTTQADTGKALGIKGTPGGFLVNVKTGKAIQLKGAVPFESLKTDIEGLLGGTAPAESLYTGTLPKLEATDRMTGAENPTVILFEYSDYECPFCKKFHPTAKQALSEYKDTFALVYRHFPLDSIHPKARPAAEASECVFQLGGEDAFWKFTNYVFEN